MAYMNDIITLTYMDDIMYLYFLFMYYKLWWYGFMHYQICCIDFLNIFTLVSVLSIVSRIFSPINICCIEYFFICWFDLLKWQWWSYKCFNRCCRWCSKIELEAGYSEEAKVVPIGLRIGRLQLKLSYIFFFMWCISCNLIEGGTHTSDEVIVLFS